MKFSDKKRPKNKATKLVIEFDEKKRAEYLLGFKKRKDVRRKKAKQEVEQTMKAEKKRIKSQKSSEHMAHMKELRSTSEIFEEQPTTTKLEYELPSHLVTVTDMGDVDFIGSTGTFLGTNSMSDIAVDGADALAANGTEEGDSHPSTHKNWKKQRPPMKVRKHVSYTHAHHKRKKMIDKEGRQKLKRKQKKNNKQHR